MPCLIQKWLKVKVHNFGNKAQMFEKVIDEIMTVYDNDKVIISLAPGFTITQLKEKLKAGRIVRSMPNTPAMIGEGMTGV